MQCLYFNARSLTNKICELQTLVTDVDLLAVTETWLKPGIENGELLPGNDFTIHRCDRTGRTGGGTLLAVRNSILSVRRKDLESNAEMLVCEIHPQNKKELLVIVFYRPPDTDLDYIKQLKKSLQLVHKTKKFDQIILCGDFNLPHIDWTTGTATTNDLIANYFTKIVKDFFLWQLVNFKTRGDNTLDLILTNIPDKVRNVQGFDDILNTDHKLLSFDINFRIGKKSKVKRVVYNFKKANWLGLKQQLTHASWDECFVPDNIDESLSNWCDLFLSAVDKYIPKHFVKNTRDHPWIDKELSLQIKKKNIQRKKLKQTQSSHDLEKYRKLRRESKKLISKKKKDYNKKLTESMFKNPKRFWSMVNSTRNSRPTVNFLRTDDTFTTDKLCMADILNTFFHSVFNPREAEPSTSTQSETLSPPTPQLSHIELADFEVVEVLRHLDPNKACGPDGIPSRLLSELADVITPSLTRLFNISVSLGVVPTKWKRANITPVFKKDDPTLSCNYRPISLLCVLSKVLERCVHGHSYHHLAPLIYKMQHGFMRGKSTTTQLLEVYHNILENVAGGEEVDVIYLDLTKAFDKVPHNTLLKKLESSGIRGPLLSWFHSYLTDRQRVVLNGICSDWLPVTSGVPQGSILGPLLFLVYCNDAQYYIQENSTLALFADDSKLFRSLDVPSCIISLQQDLNSLQKWSIDMKMQFNTKKCKVMHVSRKKLKTQTSYYLAGQQLEQVTYFTNLGVTVSNDLSRSKHIEITVAKANKTLGLIKRICRDITDPATRQLLYCTLVRPKLEYASAVWSPNTVKHCSLIENIQRRATKFILNYSKDMSYTERLIATNLLPLEFHREISDLLLVFKAKTGLIPMDINNYLCTYEPGYKSRNYDENNFNFLTKHKQQYFRNSFFIRSASLWNSIPSDLKT